MLNKIYIEKLESANEQQKQLIERINFILDDLNGLYKNISDMTLPGNFTAAQKLKKKADKLLNLKEQLYFQYTKLNQIIEIYRNVLKTSEESENFSFSENTEFNSEENYYNASYRIWSEYSVENISVSDILFHNGNIQNEDWLEKKLFEFILKNQK